jgi:UDP-N-acetylmuramoyl-tripeptide--D-alanyl-D-alanine ligase
MPGLPLGEVLRQTGAELRGTLPPKTVFPRIDADPWTVGRGELFIALPPDGRDGHRDEDAGPDGHDLAVVAALRGAAAAIVARPWADALTECPLPLIVVDQPLAALPHLASAWRQRLGLTVVGVTGSVGKTSTKEVIAGLLGCRFATVRTPGNQNDARGVPLSLLTAVPGTEVAVLEMAGAEAPGELRRLASIVHPQIAVVTNVHPVHLAGMGSVAAIAASKAELVEAVPADGTAVLYGDDPWVRSMASRCRGRVLTYGRRPSHDVWAEGIQTRGLEGCAFWATVAGERVRVDVPLPGTQAIEHVLAGFAVGHALGLGVAEMLPRLRDPALQVRLRSRLGRGGARLIDDTHNASPPSALAALALLADVPATRRIAVLGDMRELGTLARREHRTVGRAAAAVVDLLVTYGELARTIADEASRASARLSGRSFTACAFGEEQREELVAFLRAEVGEGDVVLLKGSRALHMEEITDALSLPDSPRS